MNEIREFWTAMKASSLEVVEIGGPVVVVLIVLSIISAATVFYKLWQFRRSGVGRHRRISMALEAYERGDAKTARALLAQSSSYLVAPLKRAMQGGAGPDHARQSDRCDAEAEALFSRLETGLGFLDLVAQLAPLIGLFGTVLGMIEAFQGLQAAGTSVDPTVLAGGIWVALLTTAAGLAVAMPVAAVHGWLSAAVEHDRVFANHALRRVFAPDALSPAQLSPKEAA